MNVCALGGSVATPPAGIKAKVVEVSSFDQLEALGRDKIEGKIVFYNRAMDKSVIDTFKSYGGCVDQRYEGAFHAAKLGAVAIIVRSMTLASVAAGVDGVMLEVHPDPANAAVDPLQPINYSEFNTIIKEIKFISNKINKKKY